MNIGLIPPWVKIAAVGVAVLGIAGAGFVVNGWRHKAARAAAAEAALAEYRQQVATRDRQHVQELEKERQRAEDLAADLNNLRAAYGDLLQKIPKLPLVDHHNAPPNPDGTCSVPVRSAVFRLCHNAAWSGDPAGLAACGTIRSDGTPEGLVPAAGLVRPRNP